MSSPEPTYEELAARTAQLDRELDRIRGECALYRDLIENGNDLAYSLDASGTVTYIGPPSNLLGYGADEIVGRPFTDFVHPEDRDRMTAEFESTIATGREFPSEFRLVRRDGSTVYVEDFGRAAREGETVTGMHGLLRDVSERHETRTALGRSERLYHTLVDNAREAIFTLAADFRITFANRRATEMLDRPADDLCGRDFFELTTTMCSDLLRSCMTGGRNRPTSDQDIEFRRADDSRLFGSVDIAPLEAPGGGRDGWMVCVTDITQHRMIAREFRQSEEQFRTLVENVNIGVYRNTGGPHGRFLQANPAIAEMFGYESPDEFMQVHVSELYQNADDRRRFIDEVKRIGFVRDKELRLKKRDGTPIWGSCTARATFEPNGSIRWMDGVIEDITERKEAEELRQALLDQSLLGVAVLTEDGFVFANDRFAEMMGRSVEELLGASETDRSRMVHPDDWPMVRERTVDRLRGDAVGANCEFRVVHPNGDIRWIEVWARHSDHQGRPAIHAFYVDTTARKQAEEDLRLLNEDLGRRVAARTRDLESANRVLRAEVIERRNAQAALARSRERYRILAESAQEDIFIIGPDLRVQYVNTFGAAQIHTTPDRLVGRSIDDVFPPDTADQFAGSLRHVLETGESKFVDGEMRQRDPARPSIWLETRLTALRSPEGAVEGVLGISRDITEKKQAEREVESARNYLQTLIETSLDAILVVDAEGRFEFGNRATFDIFGWPPDEFIGKFFLTVVPPDLHDFMLERWAEVQRGEGAPYETVVYHKDGTRRNLAVSHRHMTVDGQRKYCVVCKDITESKRKTERFRSVTENVPDFIMLLDPDGTVQFINRVFPGHTQGDVIGKSSYDFVDERSHPAIRRCIEGVLATGKPGSYETEMTTPDGQVRSFEARVGAVRHDGKVVSLAVTAHDITARKAAAEALRQSEEAYRSLVENIPDCVWTVGSDGRAWFVSDTIQQITGYTPDELRQGAPAVWNEAIHPDERGRVLRAHAALFEQGAPFDMEYRFRHRDGRTVWVHDRAIRTYERDGVLLADGIVSDVTARREAGEALRRSEHEKATILSNMAELVIFHNPDMTIRWANPAAALSLGVTQEEMVGELCCRLWHGSEQFCEHCPIVAARESLRPRLGEITTPDGRVWLVRGTPVIEDGELTGLVEVALEITQRRRAQEALRHSEARYRSIVEDQTEFIIRFDGNAVMTYANEASARLVGLRPAQMIGRSVFDFVHDEDRPVAREHLESLNRDEPVQRIELRADGPNGEARWTAWTTRLLGTTGDGETEFQAVGRDVNQRVLAERALRENEALLTAVIESLPFDFFAIGPDGRYRVVNSVCREHWGSLIGRRPEDAAPDDRARSIWLDNNRRAFAGETVTGEVVLRRGETAWYLYNILAPIRQDGEVRGILGMNIDITDRKLIEDELRRSEERYRAIYEAIPDPVVFYDPEADRFVDANDNMLRRFGYTRADLEAGRLGPRRLVHPDDWGRIGPLIAAHIADGGPARYPAHRNRTADGSVVWVETATTDIELEGRRLRLSIVRDVTRSVEDRTRIDRQAAILANVTDAVAVVRPDYTVTYWSPGAERMFGYTEAEMMGRPGLDVILRNPDAVSEINREIRAEFGAGREWTGTPLACRRKSDEPIWASVKLSPFTLQGFDEEGALFVARDVTDEVALQQRLIPAERMAAIGTLGLSVAHELNNMLGGLWGLAELARDDPEQVPRLIATCRAIAERGGSIAGRMSSLSKAEVAGEERRVNVAAVSQNVADMMRPSLSLKNILVETQCSTVPATWVNEGKVIQILLNLITNARDGIGEDGRIVVAVDDDRERNEVVLAVSDNGAGIPEEDLPRLFDAFFSTKRQRGPGGDEPSHLGLGLAESKSIVEGYGGTISVTSAVGEGARFTIRLPVRSAPTSEIDSSPQPDELPPEGTRMLVADDDELMRLWLSERLRAMGYDVTTAASGAEALEVCSQRAFRYIFLDVLMPGEVDGIRASRRLREIRPDARIVLATAFGRNQVPDDCAETAFAFLKKPIGPEELARALAGRQTRG
jgi:PAS domain S-box-containing protein